MKHKCQIWFGALALVSSALMAGCQGPARIPNAAMQRETSPRLTAAQSADVQIAFARSLEKSGTPEQVAAAYQDALKKDPKRADAIDRLAVLQARKGQFEQALPLHKKALALDPNNADFLCNLGYTHYLQQRWADAEAHFRKATEVDPRHSRALNNLGLVLAHTGRNQEALITFRRAGCSEADAQSNLAFVLTLENSWRDAQTHYAVARKLDPSLLAAEKGLQIVNARLEIHQPVETPADSKSVSAPKVNPTPTVPATLVIEPRVPSMPVVVTRSVETPVSIPSPTPTLVTTPAPTLPVILDPKVQMVSKPADKAPELPAIVPAVHNQASEQGTLGTVETESSEPSERPLVRPFEVMRIGTPAR